MLRKRRTWPDSSRRWGFSSGNFSSRTENNSPRLVAAQESLPTPAVWRRRAVGICTVIGIGASWVLGRVFLGFVVTAKPKAGRAFARPGRARVPAPTQTLHTHKPCPTQTLLLMRRPWPRILLRLRLRPAFAANSFRTRPAWERLRALPDRRRPARRWFSGRCR